ncbi:hypothetical protein ARMGADRAFT_1029254 [Armillaria gallica]|uniref:Uncharacterized protein n=1 Tax=Armillaria gallica TaxID=47427 RepID=A0A2H3DLE7_ARMGA|nr:hypothetical protein ARMGADRAFT_1029254 [Armillaria gallica]
MLSPPFSKDLDSKFIKILLSNTIGSTYILIDMGTFSHQFSQASIQIKPAMKGLTSALERLGVSNKGVSPKMTTMITLSRIGFRFDEDWPLDVGVLMATAMSSETGFCLHQWSLTIAFTDLPNMVPNSKSTAIMILKVRQWRGFAWMKEGDSNEAMNIKTEEPSFKNCRHALAKRGSTSDILNSKEIDL